jgi:ferredoxin
MPEFTIKYKGKILRVPQGSNLRRALLNAKLSPYKGAARHLNCHGLGSCGTCAVKITGKVSPLTIMEKWRLGFPPHKRSSGLRLACQVKVQGDLIVEKGTGFWGQKIDNRQPTMPNRQ